jgi:hypothetical protein
MTVKELKELLEQAKPNDLVILSSDEEGNSFHALYEITPERVVSTEYGYEAVEGGKRTNAIILWPA